MDILSIIPARGGSKGIPMKNLALLNKTPLLRYSLNSSLHSKYISKTVVSTDNKIIENYSRKFKNVETIIRPKKLATDYSQIEPVILHTLDYLLKKFNYKPDIIVLLQNTSPLRTFYHVDAALNFFLKNNYDSLLSVFLTHKFLWKKQKKNYFPTNYDPKNRPNRQDIEDQFFENGSIYITKYSSFLKTKCRISGNIGIYEMTEEDSIEIDSPFDLLHAQLILKNRKHHGI